MLKRLPNRSFRALIATVVLAFGGADPALATTYTLQSGTMLITVDEYSPTQDRIYRAADSVKVDIVSAVLSVEPDQALITGFEIAASPQIQLVLNPDTPGYDDGYRTLIIESFAVNALSGTLLANGAGFALDGDVSIDVTFAGSGAGAYGSYAGHPGEPLLTAAVGPGPIHGNVYSDGEVSLSGTARGLFASPFNDSRLILTGSFSFTAAPSGAPVPEPDALLLFLAGLTVAAASAGRRRTTRPAGLEPRL